jgi:FkbM family methyltransferase
LVSSLAARHATHPYGFTPSPHTTTTTNHQHTTEHHHPTINKTGKGRVALRQGDVVLDLGANVGSFARMAAPLVGPSGRVLCVEPIEEVVEALRLNVKRYERWARARAIPAAPIVPVHAGVGTAADAARGSRAFVYYPRVTAMSTMYPDEDDATAATFSLVIHRPECFSALEALAKPLARCAPALYRFVHGAVFRRALLRPVRVVECPMRTVSDLIDDYRIPEVGLLKANVERAEWDVLAGVREEHWPRIRQVSLQVHDVRGRVGRMRKFLSARGFEVSVYKEPRFAECCLHMVYGTKV